MAKVELPAFAFSEPTDYARLFGFRNVYGWQQIAMNHVWARRNIALCVCNSAGKTSIVETILGLAIMSHYPGSTVVSTSGSWLQIETQLVPALRYATAGIPGWKITKEGLTAPPVVVDGKPLQSRWIFFSTDDPKRAEGHHDKKTTGDSGQDIILRVAYFIDEAKGVADGIFDAMSRCRVSFKMICSSPGEDQGGFFQAVEGKYKELWTPMTVDWTQCPHLYEDPIERRKIEKEIRVKGREHPLIKSQYFAEFFQGIGYRVFNAEDIRMSMAGLIPKYGSDRCGAFDWSAGGDEQVWGIREGNTQLEPFKIFHEKDSVKLAKMLIPEFKRWKLEPSEIVMDAGGGGTVFIQVLEDMGYRGIRQYNNGAEAIDSVNYANVYTEDCFEKLAFRLKVLKIIKDDKLEKQMREREYCLPNSDGNRRRLVSKEKLRAAGKDSPDRLDTILMMFSTYRTSKKLDQHINSNNICPTIQDCLKEREEECVSSFTGGWNMAD